MIPATAIFSVALSEGRVSRQATAPLLWVREPLAPVQLRLPSAVQPFPEIVDELNHYEDAECHNKEVDNSLHPCAPIHGHFRFDDFLTIHNGFLHHQLIVGKNSCHRSPLR